MIQGLDTARFCTHNLRFPQDHLAHSCPVLDLWILNLFPLFTINRTPRVSFSIPLSSSGTHGLGTRQHRHLEQEQTYYDRSMVDRHFNPHIWLATLPSSRFTECLLY